MACGCDGVDSGSFRNELIIEEVTLVDDGAGGRSKTWSTLKTIRVQAIEKSGGESFRRQNINTNERIVFTGWFDSQIEADKGLLRLNYRSKIYNLTRVNNMDGKDIFMELTGELERMRTS